MNNTFRPLGNGSLSKQQDANAAVNEYAGMQLNNLKELKELENQSRIADHDFERDLEEKKLGRFGKYLGGPENVSVYIAGLALIILIIALFWFLFFYKDCDTQAVTNTVNATYTLKKDVLSLIVPVITAIVGFLFGKKN